MNCIALPMKRINLRLNLHHKKMISKNQSSVKYIIPDYWTSSALIVGVIADNEKLGGGSAFGRSLGADDSDLDKEEFNRNVQEVLRGEERTYRAWGIAIDLNLESEDEGQTAAIFIMLTVVAAVIIVGISLRSYWAMALTGNRFGGPHDLAKGHL